MITAADNGKVAFVSGAVSEYRGNLQVIADVIRLAEAEDQYDLAELIPTAPIDVGQSYQDMERLVASITDDDYRVVCTAVLERFGVRPLAYMESLGWTGPDVWYAHGIHFNDTELKLLADTGTGVAHCPISNMKLSSGVCRIPEMLELGVPVGLAVDGSASNDGSSLLEELRTAYLLHRLHSSERAPSGYDLLKIATRGSARVLGREDIGSLEPGKAGDLFLIRRDRLELVGADLDVKSMLGTVGFKGPVDASVVNGRVVVKDGRLTGVDEEKAVREARAAVSAYLSRG